LGILPITSIQQRALLAARDGDRMLSALDLERAQHLEPPLRHVRRP
jgi:hypothetical protein